MSRTLAAARAALLDMRRPEGHWVGELSSSALSTATAVCGLAILERSHPRAELSALVRGGLNWLAAHQNADGGWGDTVDSPSNLSTTTLAWSALELGHREGYEYDVVVERARGWLERAVGELSPPQLAQAVKAAYGADQTFSVPILTMCALTGVLGAGREAWRLVPSLPFELAALPRSWFRRVGLPVVSYALPALIALGQARHVHLPTRNPVARLMRGLTRGRTLRVLEQIQPETGGFLEAIPLTSFVVMSLVSVGDADHPVVERGVAFLRASVRADGSWPIDTNLSTWISTLSIDALAADALGSYSSSGERARLCTWLLRQQHCKRHAYTQAAPGGWAWTNLSGGVPDADDTAGALLALKKLVEIDAAAGPEVRSAASAGVTWLLDLQNRDGGIPTFCRGWGKLPFDRSTPDLTAHALRAWRAWQASLPGRLADRVERARVVAVRYLLREQRVDGSWVPLWFGNQHTGEQTNPLYGTTHVLRALGTVDADDRLGGELSRARSRALAWIQTAQNDDGGWGGTVGTPSTVEETALAVRALAFEGGSSSISALARGCGWLVERTREGCHFPASPIGLYFAKLWYSESLYPLIYTVAAFSAVEERRERSVQVEGKVIASRG